MSSNGAVNGHGESVAAVQLRTGKPKKMGSAINRSLISAHFSIRVYFLTVQTYKCMRLTTRVYSKTLADLNLAVVKADHQTLSD